MKKVNWTKEEIMALVDGELSQNEENKLKTIIQNDDDARQLYEKYIMSDELLGLTYNQIEKSFITKNTQSINISNEENKKAPKGFGAISISLGNLITGSLILAAIVAFAGYQLGLKNIQNSNQSEKYYEIYAMNKVLSNQGILKEHVFSNSAKDLKIKVEDNKTMLFKVVDRNIKNNKFCQRYGMKFENRDFIVEACNDNIESEKWSYTLKSKSLE